MERWRAALGRLGADAQAFAWRYGAFELDPGVPPEGVDRDAYMAGRYDPATVKAMGERLAQIARREGLQMADPATLRVRPSTFAAHRLMTAALEAGVGVQQALGDALFAAYWGRGEDIGDHGVLAAAAQAAGMDAAAAAACSPATRSRPRCAPRSARRRASASTPCRPSSSTAAPPSPAPRTRRVLADAARRALGGD